MICLFGLPKAVSALSVQIFFSISCRNISKQFSIASITGDLKTYKPHLLTGRLTACLQLNNNHRQKSNDADSKMLNNLPFFACGEIVPGFGRGSKELGIPTANYSLEIVKSLPAALHTGIYYGWANVDNSDVYKMVMSIGWNPFYNNTERSMETHIMHNFNRDLYGCLLKVCIVGYLRPEKNFTSLEELKIAIQNDIDHANVLLDNNEESEKLKNSKFFKDNTHAVKQNDVYNEKTKPKNGS